MLICNEEVKMKKKKAWFIQNIGKIVLSEAKYNYYYCVVCMEVG